jgi:hypothetical protein
MALLLCRVSTRTTLQAVNFPGNEQRGAKSLIVAHRPDLPSPTTRTRTIVPKLPRLMQPKMKGLVQQVL